MMTKRISIIAGAMLAFALLGATVPAAVTEKTLRVDGMTCAGCSASVEHALKKVDGVIDVKAAPGPKGTFRIKFDDEKVGLEKIKKVIDDAGFHVVEKRIGPAK